MEATSPDTAPPRIPVGARGDFATIDGKARHAAAALDAGTGKLLPWRVGTSTNDPFSVSTAITATDHWVILGGDYTRINGAPRAGIAAVSVTGSTVASWHPTRHEGDFEATFIAAGDDLYVYDYDDAALAVFSTGT